MNSLEVERADAEFLLTQQSLDRFHESSWRAAALVTAKAIASMVGPDDPTVVRLVSVVNYGPRDYFLLQAGRYHNARPFRDATPDEVSRALATV